MAANYKKRKRRLEICYSKTAAGLPVFCPGVQIPSAETMFFYYAAVLSEVLNIIMMRLLIQSKHCPLHFSKRRPEPEGTADRFQALLPEAQR